MMSRQLKDYNTFGIEAKCSNFIEFKGVEELEKFFPTDDMWLVVGGGSNILFTKDYEGTILHPISKEIVVESVDGDSAYIKVDAGVVWDDFVEFAISNNYYSVENLSLIPGSVGASPVQNIGAYGVEAKDVIFEVEYYNVTKGCVEVINNENCKFGYRDSIFKRELRGKAVVLSVTFKLTTTFMPNLSYGTLSEMKNIGESLCARDVRQLIVETREAKLPDPAIIGNGGSFFKNPVVSMDRYNTLKEEYPTMPSYPASQGVKIPAGWLIEQSGWKGRRIGDAGVHQNQALVLVNYGGATGEEVLSVAKQVQKAVSEKFEIEIETEINII